jgi:hypothetical protein
MKRGEKEPVEELQKNGDRNNVNALTHSILFSHSNEHGALKNTWWPLGILKIKQ